MQMERSMSIFPDDLIASEEVARELGVKNQTLAAWRCIGRGPHFYKVGRAVMYSKSDIIKWIEAQRREPRVAANAA